MASVLGMNEGWTGDDQPQFKGMTTHRNAILTTKSMASLNHFATQLMPEIVSR
jgi:hypothetical protein